MCDETERGDKMSEDGEKCCLNCKIFWDKEYCCEECRFEDEDHPSLFYQITRSPETLAEKLVYIDSSQRVFNTIWRSTLLPNKYWKTEAEAIAATVARLKEVCNG